MTDDESKKRQLAMMQADLLRRAAWMLTVDHRAHVGIVVAKIANRLEDNEEDRLVTEYERGLKFANVGADHRAAAVASIEKREYPEDSLDGQVNRLRLDAIKSMRQDMRAGDNVSADQNCGRG